MVDYSTGALLVKVDIRKANRVVPVRQEVQLWIGRKSVTRQALESVVGRLAHASRVVKPGKTFLKHLFELLLGAQRAYHHF